MKINQDRSGIPIDQNRCDYCSLHFPKGDHEGDCRACAEFAIVPPRLWIAPSDIRELAKNNPDRMDIAIPFYPKSYHLREVALLLNEASHPGTWLDGSDEVLRVIEKARDLLLEIMDEG